MHPRTDGFTVMGNSRLNRLVTPVSICACDHEFRTCCTGSRLPARAIWDPATVQTAVSQHLIDTLRLVAVPFLKIDSSPAYLVNVHLTDTVLLTSLPVGLISRSSHACDIVIGMDVIRTAELSITVVGGETVVSYCRRRFP